jgi:hypothetical protein
MSYLAVTPFDTANLVISATQRITSPVAITVVRANMLKHGTISDGTLTLDILDGATVIGTSTITAAEFETVGATYAHGYFSFPLDGATMINLQSEAYKEITYRFTMSGHTNDVNNYVGLIRQFDDPFVSEFGSRPTASTAADDGWFNPYGIEIYSIARG